MTDSKKGALSLALAGVGFSVFAFVVNAVFDGWSPRLAQMCALGIVMGNTLCVLGCVQLAIAKGRGWWVGLLGLLNFLGLAILWFGVKPAR